MSENSVGSVNEPTGDDYFMSDLVAQRDYLQSRRADKWIPFLLPYLKPGMRVLDCGCGQGSITCDVAERVAPGDVVGIDFDPEQVTDATALAEKRGISNVSFQHGSIYDLDFFDETFDVVYAHAVLQHVSDRDKAISEMKRVLKPSGIVGIADDDFTTLVTSPDECPARNALRLIENVITHRGGDLRYSRHLRSLLLRAGFAEVEGHLVSAEYYGSLEETRRAARIIRRVLVSDDFMAVITGQDWISRAGVERLLIGVVDWADKPDSFLGVTYVAAVAWKSPQKGSE